MYQMREKREKREKRETRETRENINILTLPKIPRTTTTKTRNVDSREKGVCITFKQTSRSNQKRHHNVTCTTQHS